MEKIKPQMYLLRYRVSTDQKYGMFLCTEIELPQIMMDCIKKNEICRFVVKKQ